MNGKITLIGLLALLALLGASMGWLLAYTERYETKEAAELHYELLEKSIQENSAKLDRILDRLDAPK